MPETLDKLDTPAAKGLKAAIARNRKLKADKERARAAPAPAAPAEPQKPAAKWHPPKTDAEKAEFNAANARVTAVMSHPAFVTHTKTAARLLANPKLSAAEIGQILDIVTANTPAAQDAALVDMQAALAEAKRLHPSAGVTASAGSHAAVWDYAIEKVFASREVEA